jgi:hypothetical protein
MFPIVAGAILIPPGWNYVFLNYDWTVKGQKFNAKPPRRKEIEKRLKKIEKKLYAADKKSNIFLKILATLRLCVKNKLFCSGLNYNAGNKTPCPRGDKSRWLRNSTP